MVRVKCTHVMGDLHGCPVEGVQDAIESLCELGGDFGVVHALTLSAGRHVEAPSFPRGERERRERMQRKFGEWPPHAPLPC